MAYSNSRQDEETKSDYATTNGLFNMSDEQAKSSTRHESLVTDHDEMTEVTKVDTPPRVDAIRDGVDDY
jgi:hypothetical protein